MPGCFFEGQVFPSDTKVILLAGPGEYVYEAENGKRLLIRVLPFEVWMPDPACRREILVETGVIDA